MSADTQHPEVIVGVDGSKAARVAVAEACDAARNRGARVVLYHAVYLPTLIGRRLSEEATARAKDYGAQVLAHERTLLKAELGDRFPDDVEEFVWAGHVHDGLEQIAHDPSRDVQLVVLGSRGLGGFSSMALGSVTTHAVAHLQVPVLVVPGRTAETAA